MIRAMEESIRQEKLASFHRQIDKHIDHFFIHSERHKKIYRRLRYAVMVLSGAATVLVAFALKSGEKDRPNFELAISVVTVATTIASGVEAVRKPADLWVRERGILHGLRDLKSTVEYETADPGFDPDKAFQKMLTILSASQREWAANIKTEKPPVAGLG